MVQVSTTQNNQKQSLLFKDGLQSHSFTQNVAADTLDMVLTLQRQLQDAKRELTSKNIRIQRLEKLATTDELTGISNRRGFTQAFKRENDRVQRDLGKGGILALIDLDNFKSINDTYGHGCGDACLKIVANALVATSRDTDTAARLGGDEFVLLLPDTTKKDIAARAQNISTMLNNLSLIWKGEEIQIKASVGLKTFREADTIEEIIQDADKDMYATKQKRKTQSKIH